MLTLLGSLFGGLLRLAPEGIKLWDAKNQRAHELAMFDRQLEADRLRGQQALAQTQLQGDITRDAGELQALIEATKAQGQMTGIAWIDGLNQLVRPALTYWWCIGLYTAAMVAEFYVLVVIKGASNVDAVLTVFGDDEKAIVASMLSFWFVDRTLRKMK